MDIAVESMCYAKVAQHANHTLHCVVRREEYAGTQEKPFNIITAVKFECEFGEFFDCKGCAWDIVTLAVYAVCAVIRAVVG